MTCSMAPTSRSASTETPRATTRRRCCRRLHPQEHPGLADLDRAGNAQIRGVLERAREHALRAGDAYELAQIRQALVRAAAVGPMAVDEAVVQCQEILEEASGDRLTEALTANGLAYLEAMRGRFDEARRLGALSRSMLNELGLTYTMAAMDDETRKIPQEIALIGAVSRHDDQTNANGTRGRYARPRGHRRTSRRSRHVWPRRGTPRADSTRPSG